MFDARAVSDPVSLAFARVVRRDAISSARARVSTPRTVPRASISARARAIARSLASSPRARHRAFVVAFASSTHRLTRLAFADVALTRTVELAMVCVIAFMASSCCVATRGSVASDIAVRDGS